MLSAILSFSILLQTTAAVLALRLIRITGRQWAWISIASAMLLMDVRRCITFYQLLLGNTDTPATGFTAELVALAISAFMVTGMVGIGSLIAKIQQAEQVLRNAHDELEQHVQERTAELTRMNTALQQEITVRKQTEAALREKNNLLNTILESTTDAIFINDVEGRYVLANSADRQALGRTMEEPIGQHLTEIFGPTTAQLLLEENRQVMVSGQSRTFEHQLAITGETRFYSVTKAPYWNDAGQIQGVIGIARDITEHRLNEVQARQQQHTVAHMARLSLVGEMASSLAHELNQPLSAIGIYAETAGAVTAKVNLQPLRFPEEQATELLSLLEKIVTQSQRAGEIIRRMKHFTRKTNPLRKTEDINKLIKEAVGLIEFMIQQQHVTLHFHLTNEPLLALVDAIQIQQVILNLMYNAIEAMQDIAINERELRIQTLWTASNRIEVRVCDTGPSLSGAAQEKLFQPFFTTKPTGTGLGLSISKSIIDAHSGQLWATPQAVRGIMFRFTLPAVKQEI